MEWGAGGGAAAGDRRRIGPWRLRLSRHAEERMRERGIGFDEVVEAIENPVQYMYDRWRDLYIAVSPRGHAVVYAIHGDEYEIVTVLRRREYEALVSKHGRSRYRFIA